MKQIMGELLLFYGVNANVKTFIGSVGLRISGSHDGFMVLAILGPISPGECHLWEFQKAYDIRRG